MRADSATDSSQGKDARAPLDAEDILGRATAGAALLGARSGLIYVFGIGANLLLARLLVPRDFGLIALGTALLVAGGFLAEGGFGAALIGRPRPPARAELEAFYGLQLAVATALAALFAAGAAPFGEDGLVVAAMVFSLPIRTLRLPSVIVLERQLEYRVIAAGDVVEATTYYVWAIGAVLLGLGVWGLATAAVVRAVAGSATVIAMGPLGLVRPRWSWPLVRPLLGFGAKFQATALLQLGREQGMNVAVAAIAGIATLGVWNLAWRVAQVPNLLFMIVGRVAFPAISRMLEAGHDPRRAIERGLAALAALTGLVVVGIVGFAPAIPALVGDAWHDVPAVLLWSGLGLIVAAPITVAATGYLFAVGEAGAVAMATLASAVAWFGVTLPLLSRFGAPAVGVGWLAAGIVSSAYLWRRMAVRTGAAIAAHLARPTAVALAAAVSGWLVADRARDGAVAGVLGLAGSELILVAGLMLVSRPALRDIRSLAAQALSPLRARHTIAPPVRSPAPESAAHAPPQGP
jgi:O-antigen/teichoic acid export membrane protein